MVVINAFSLCRESRRVCCTTMGTFDSISVEYSVLCGMRSGSLRALKRTCFERRAGTVTSYGPAGSRSLKKIVIVTEASLSELFKSRPLRG